MCKNTWNQANKYRLLLCELADRLGYVNYVWCSCTRLKRTFKTFQTVKFESFKENDFSVYTRKPLKNVNWYSHRFTYCATEEFVIIISSCPCQRRLFLPLILSPGSVTNCTKESVGFSSDTQRKE